MRIICSIDRIISPGHEQSVTVHRVSHCLPGKNPFLQILSFQIFEAVIIDRHVPGTFGRLGILKMIRFMAVTFKLLINKCMLYADNHISEIDIIPRKGRQFTRPKSGIDGDVKEIIIPSARTAFKE